jgi:hypothetical protein
MPAPQCGLPPLANMTLPLQQPSTAIPPSPTRRTPLPCLLPPSLTRSRQRRDPWPQLLDPPQRWRGAEESMRDWLQASVEENKKRQTEERTRQESLRLEQRKVEMDMMCTSLQGGIPPALIPLVFVRMGSGGAHLQIQHVQSSQQESQPSSSMTVYNLQPPISQARSNSNQPGAPSASTKTKRH